MKILNGNTMLKMKRNKVKMMTKNKSLLLKIFPKWTSKSFWTMKILKLKIKISKKKKNLNNKKRNKTNKKAYKKWKNKMVNKLKKKVKLKNHNSKRKELEAQNMNHLLTLAKKSSKS